MFFKAWLCPPLTLPPHSTKWGGGSQTLYSPPPPQGKIPILGPFLPILGLSPPHFGTTFLPKGTVCGGGCQTLFPPPPPMFPLWLKVLGGGSQPLPPRLLKIPILGPILLFLGPFLPILDPPHPHFFGRGPPLNSPPSNIAAHGAPFGDGGSRFMSLPHAPRLNCWFFLGGGGS